MNASFNRKGDWSAIKNPKVAFGFDYDINVKTQNLASPPNYMPSDWFSIDANSITFS